MKRGVILSKYITIIFIFLAALSLYSLNSFAQGDCGCEGGSGDVIIWGASSLSACQYSYCDSGYTAQRTQGCSGDVVITQDTSWVVCRGGGTCTCVADCAGYGVACG